MGAIIGWATLAVKRKKNEGKTFEDLQKNTRFWDQQFKITAHERKCQEALTRLLREQLSKLRRTMATHCESLGALREQDKIVQKRYDEAKRELKRLDLEQAKYERSCRASRQQLNDLMVDLEDEKRRNRGRIVRDNSWMTQTL